MVICSGPCCVMDGVHNICTLLLPKPRHKLPGEVGTEQVTFANAFQSQMKEAQSGSPVLRECGKDHVRAKPRTLLNSKPRPRPPQEFGDRSVLRALLQLFGGDLCLSTFSGWQVFCDVLLNEKPRMPKSGLGLRGQAGKQKGLILVDRHRVSPTQAMAMC